MPTDTLYLERMRGLVDKLGGPTKAARTIGVSRESIYKWSDGKSRAPFAEMVALCRASGVPVDWLANGKNRPSPPEIGLDEELIHQIVVTLVEWLNDKDLTIDGENFWRICRVFYDASIEDDAQKNPGEIVDFSAAQQMLELVAKRR